MRTTYILFKHIKIYIYYITIDNLVLATSDFYSDFIVGAVTVVTSD